MGTEGVQAGVTVGSLACASGNWSSSASSNRRLADLSQRVAIGREPRDHPSRVVTASAAASQAWSSEVEERGLLRPQSGWVVGILY